MKPAYRDQSLEHYLHPKEHRQANKKKPQHTHEEIEEIICSQISAHK